jgi:hypothetical protein
MRSRQQCPKGAICFSWSMFAVIIILGAVLYIILEPFYRKQHIEKEEKLYHFLSRLVAAKPTPPPAVTVIARGGDDRYTRAPDPIRRPWEGSLPSIATRGDYGPYQQMGILERKDGTFYPLYGRRTYNRDRFNYYTRTDTYNPVSIPVQYEKRDCTDDTGCNEISSGDNVRIAGNEDVKVKLYNSSVMQ